MNYDTKKKLILQVFRSQIFPIIIAAMLIHQHQ